MHLIQQTIDVNKTDPRTKPDRSASTASTPTAISRPRDIDVEQHKHKPSSSQTGVLLDRKMHSGAHRAKSSRGRGSTRHTAVHSRHQRAQDARFRPSSRSTMPRRDRKVHRVEYETPRARARHSRLVLVPYRGGQVRC